MTKLSANRVVLILHGVFIGATLAVVFVSTLSNSLPHAWQADAAFAVTLLGGIAAATTTVTKFLDGSQKFDQIQGQVPPKTAVVSVQTGRD